MTAPIDIVGRYRYTSGMENHHNREVIFYRKTGKAHTIQAKVFPLSPTGQRSKSSIATILGKQIAVEAPNTTMGIQDLLFGSAYKTQLLLSQHTIAQQNSIIGSLLPLGSRTVEVISQANQFGWEAATSLSIIDRT